MSWAKQSSSIDEASSDLDRILKQLRPFQRQAYNFATQGSKANAADKTNAQNNPYQKAQKAKSTSPSSSETLLGNGRLLLGDEMGLGKSCTSLAIMLLYRQEWPLLILCPASLRHTWPAEIEKFLPQLPPSAIYVVQGFDDADFFENAAKKKKIQIVVATYSLLQNRSAAARVLKQFKFKCVIADESHNLKQKNSQRAQLALPLLESAKRLVLLSGTPALARPVELWTQVYAIAPDLFGSYTSYTKQYCNARRGRFGWDVSGLSNAEELHAKLKQIMIRRLKADVLHELPPKQRSMVPVPISKSKRKECENIMQQLKETRQSVQDLVGEEAYGANFEARRLLMEAYQASGVGKSEGICEYLLDWLRGSGTQKVLIFAHHKAVLDAIEVAVAKELKGAGHIRIDGTVNSHERAVRVKKFQTSKTVRVAILSVTAAGVGLTLTAASSVMFAELHWTPGVLAQAEDRCHRIGQRNAVNVMYLVCEDPSISVDMQLWEMIGRKVNNLGRVVDGERNTSLDASRADDGGPRREGTQSVQAELQSFFADTSNKSDKSQMHKTPAKGTIMSFFAKQKNQDGKLETKALVGTPGNIASRSSKETSLASASPSDNQVQWDCTACTFMNSSLRLPNTRLACEMCGTAFPENSNRRNQTSAQVSNLVTPRSAPRDNQKVVASSTGVASSRSTKDSEVIVIDDDDESVHNRREDPAERPKQFLPRASDVIVLDDVLKRSASPRTTSTKRARMDIKTFKPKISQNSRVVDEASENPLILFSVSKNSGRVMIHYTATKKASLVSFELEEILSNETVDSMMEVKLNRKLGSMPSVPLVFDHSALEKILAALDKRQVGLHSKGKCLESIKSFVRQFIALREVEKKRLRECGGLFSSLNVLQQLLLLTALETSSGPSTERYSGGAKEHARARLEDGAATKTDMAVLEGRLCAFCAGDLSAASRVAGVISTYCSKECAEEGRLKRGGMYASTRIRAQVFALEGGVCRLCGIDAHALYTRVASLTPAERLNAMCNVNWKLPKTSKALDRLLQNPKEGDFWQADHITAVAEGGGGCDLENLRTLCVPCHTQETERLRGRLKLAGPTSSQEDSNSFGRQTDIRSLFAKK